MPSVTRLFAWEGTGTHATERTDAKYPRVQVHVIWMLGITAVVGELLLWRRQHGYGVRHCATGAIDVLPSQLNHSIRIYTTTMVASSVVASGTPLANFRHGAVCY